MFKDNLVELRKIHDMSQEELADIIGVSRQTLSKYETGESLPDIEKCKLIANAFGVSIDDLLNYEPKENMGLAVPPKGKHIFGIVKVGDKGQIVLPAKARKNSSGFRTNCSRATTNPSGAHGLASFRRA